MSSRPDRKEQLKAKAASEGPRRREETVKQIRKSKKEEQLMKRRQAATAPVQSDEPNIEKPTIADIPSLMSVLRGGNQNKDALLEAVRGFRRMLSVETNPPVHAVIDAGALPFLVSYLEKEDVPMLIFESAWALTNVASTNRTGDVVDAGALPSLIKLLRHRTSEIREQAAWCIGNIAGDCCELRDLVLRLGALEGLILNMNEPETMSLLNNVTWSVSNLCRGKPNPEQHLIEPALAPLANLLSRDVSVEVMVDAVWALSYLADGDNDMIESVMNTNITPRLIEFLSNGHGPLMTPTVRCLGNFVTGSDVQTQKVIDAGILNNVYMLLEYKAKNIRKETCWLLSNIAAGSADQIEALFKEPDIIRKVIDLASNATWDIRKEAIWVLSNIFTTGTEVHVRGLVQHKALHPICLALGIQDSKILMVALEAVERILAVGDKYNLGYTGLLDEHQGIDRLEALQEHQNDGVYQKSIELIERFFGIDEEEDENVAPSQEDGMYNFGLSEIPSKQLFPSENDYLHPQPIYSPEILRTNHGNMDMR